MMHLLLLVVMVSVPRSRQAEIPADKLIGMYGLAPDTNAKANNVPTMNYVDPKLIESIFKPFINTKNENDAAAANNSDREKINSIFNTPITTNNTPTNNGPMNNINGPTPATTTQANNNPANQGIDWESLKKIFNTTNGPSTNNPTVAPTLSTSGGYPTTTTVTYSDTCQCVPYNLCNKQNEGFNVYNSNLTGYTVIDMRFNEEYCEDSMDKCCKIPTLPTATTTQKPPAKKPKGCGYRNKNGIEVFHTNTDASMAQFGEFPWVVALMNTFNNSYIGAGVLIHPQVVLTAAHVVSLSAPDVIKIRAGEWDTKTVREPFPHEERQVQMIQIHPGHRNEVNDVAMLQLDKPLELTEHINTICLPDQGEGLDTAKNCIANGWGKDRFGSDAPFSVILKKLELDMVEHSRCNTLLRYTRLGPWYNLHNSVICAGGEEGKDMCSGDGGGPLACPIDNNNDRYKLAGLVVGGIGCGKKSIPGLYLSLPATRSWVDEKMNALSYGISAYTI